MYGFFGEVGWVAVVFEDVFDDDAESGSDGFAAGPVDGDVFLE